MKLQIFYQNQPGIEVQTITVLASFCSYHPDSAVMQPSENGWVYETELAPGDYYYKFLINGTLLLNDPLANCYAPRNESEEELWSFLRVGPSGERLYNSTSYPVYLEDYRLSGSFTEGTVINRRQFSAELDKKIVAGFGFRNTEGVHTVTVLWTGPDNTPREYAEAVLGPQETPEQLERLWFWLDTEALEQPEGVWTLLLFIDGAYVLEDRFQIGNALSYSRDGTVNNRY